MIRGPPSSLVGGGRVGDVRPGLGRSPRCRRRHPRAGRPYRSQPAQGQGMAVEHGDEGGHHVTNGGQARRSGRGWRRDRRWAPRCGRPLALGGEPVGVQAGSGRGGAPADRRRPKILGKCFRGAAIASEGVTGAHADDGDIGVSLAGGNVTSSRRRRWSAALLPRGLQGRARAEAGCGVDRRRYSDEPSGCLQCTSSPKAQSATAELIDRRWARRDQQPRPGRLPIKRCVWGLPLMGAAPFGARERSRPDGGGPRP